MYACVDTDIRNQHWDYLLQEYYNTFADTMTKLESTSNITLDSLKIDMKKYGLCGFAICMDAVTMCNLDDENVVDMDTIQVLIQYYIGYSFQKFSLKISGNV